MEEHTGGTNLETTIFPLLSICSLTNEYRKKTDISKVKCSFPKLSLMEELPKSLHPRIQSLLDVCQKNFEKEAMVLLKNNLSNTDIDVLFSKYKEYVLNYIVLKTDYFGISNFQNSSECTSWENTDLLFDSINQSDIGNLSYNLSDFEFDNFNIHTQENLIDSSLLQFETSAIPKAPEPEYTEYTKFFQEIPSESNKKVPQTIVFSANPNSSDNFSTSKRRLLSKENQKMLNALFDIKRFPNSNERKLIAEKCKMTPSQVRVWFTNKRARYKRKH